MEKVNNRKLNCIKKITHTRRHTIYLLFLFIVYRRVSFESRNIYFRNEEDVRNGKNYFLLKKQFKVKVPQNNFVNMRTRSHLRENTHSQTHTFVLIYFLLIFYIRTRKNKLNRKKNRDKISVLCSENACP